MKLRPHHLLCIQGYSVKGYSEEFVKNMTENVRKLWEEEGTMVTLTDGTDQLCMACPNRLSERQCRDDAKVLSFDRKVLEYFGLETGRTYRYMDLIREIDSRMTPELMEDICGSCSWYPVSACRRNVLSGKYVRKETAEKTGMS